MQIAAEVQVWPVTLQVSDGELQWFADLLAPDEAARAARYRFERDRRSFTVCRGVLRVLLGRYLATEPKIIEFSYGSKGKPELVNSGICFNVAHSGGMGLIAFARECEIGADVEAMRPMDDLHSIARQFFCAEESEELMSLPLEQRQQAFFNCWTRKEAFLKAIGEGLNVPLNQFRVTLRPGEQARLVSVNQMFGDAAQWSMHSLALGPDHTGAVAYRGRPKKLDLMETVSASEFAGR
jgi:4'-phosphopantetheinyl transferase